MAPVTCPRCDANVPDAEVMTELGVAHCPACDHTFDLVSAPAPPEPSVPGRYVPDPPTQTEAQQVDVIATPARYEATIRYDVVSENLGCGCAAAVATLGLGGTFLGMCGDSTPIAVIAGSLALLAIAREAVSVARWAGGTWTVAFTEAALESQQGSAAPVEIPWNEITHLVHVDERWIGLQRWVYAVDAQGHRTPVARVHQDTAKWLVQAASAWAGRSLEGPED